MPVTIEQRREILQKEVTGYVRRGFRVVSQTDTTAQLVKSKSFSFFWAFIWLLALGVGLIVYLLYYWSKRDEQVYLEVNEDGHVKRR